MNPSVVHIKGFLRSVPTSFPISTQSEGGVCLNYVDSLRDFLAIVLEGRKERLSLKESSNGSNAIGCYWNLGVANQKKLSGQYVSTTVEQYELDIHHRYNYSKNHVGRMEYTYVCVCDVCVWYIITHLAT